MLRSSSLLHFYLMSGGFLFFFLNFGPFPASFWDLFFLSLIHWYDTMDIFTMVFLMI